MKRKPATRPVGRPKILKQPSTLNLSVDMEIKRKAFALATVRGCSISALISSLLTEAEAKAV